MNVAELVSGAAHEHGDRPALRTLDGQTRTWAQVADEVAAMAAALRDRGVKPGDRVALALPNSLAFPPAFWGALRAGAVVVPVNPAYTAREVAHLIGDSGACLAVADPGLRDVVEAAVAIAGSTAAVATCDELGEVGVGDDAPALTGDDDVAVICYTSGTTGRPKGAVLTHANFLANLESIGDLPRLRVEPADVLLGLLPFFHIFGLNVILNGAARHGASVLAMERFSPVGSLQQLAEHGVTVAYGAPPVYAAWCAIPAQAVPPLPALRAAVSGADALPVSVWHAFRERFGIEILEGYGLTETAPVLASSAAAPQVRPGTVGHPVPGVRLRIADPLGRDLPPTDEGDEVGEICASGPNVFVGYHGQSEATADVLSEGWFRTGDLGSVDADGYLRIAGRLKDMVIVSGFNVYPREVEQVLIEHDDIADAAVIGLPDERTGERVRAVVVTEPGSALSVDDVLDHCRTRLARYKLPREVRIVESIPRLPTGKVHRDALRSG